MSGCTAPVYGHRSASAASNCPVCRNRSSARRPSYYDPPPAGSIYRSGGSGGRLSSTGVGSSRSRRTRSGNTASYSSSEWRSIEPLVQKAEEQARAFPAKKDLFLCHAWDDREASAAALYELLLSYGATVWFSERDLGLGKSLLREIDRGLANSRIGIVLVTPAMLRSLLAEGVADKELSALLATDRVIPIAHETTFEALREVSPLLASRSGLDTAESSMEDVAAKIAAAAAALAEID
ncbi:toll/interleukin-1 receptor domain-containing protein [Tsukamurella sp. PLM1]|uniref:toll/interleukin-1 receptor domain-containing protein n=1 Tax=Tsukamurella sp. PLM1 TaxID=2929795 RepID=UPI0020534D33|nr:toll/interleukin-1 receptor domain-containing protein [Tsukamurella sp. PLM1]BDH59755.1 TIR domain-containing protein [Tsukamurella sp. PLM1]